MPRGTSGLSARWRKRLECLQVFFATRLTHARWVKNSARFACTDCAVWPATTVRLGAGKFSRPLQLSSRGPRRALDTSWAPYRLPLTTLVARAARFASPGKQGTPVRIRDGPAAVSRRRGRSLRAIVDRPLPGPSHEKACGRLSLGVRRPTRAREFAFLRGRGGRHGRPRPVERSSSNAPASTRSAGGVNGPGSDCARAGAWRCACMR